MADKGDKTEKPTHWRLQKAKKEGNVPRSKEITEGFILLMLAISMIYYLPFLGKTIINSFNFFYSLAANMRVNEENFIYLMGNALSIFALILIPITIIFIGVSFITTIAQGGFKFRLKKLSLNLERLNFFKGVKKILVSRGTIVELIKNFIKIIVIGWIAYTTLKGNLDKIVFLSGRPLDIILRDMGTIAFSIAFKVAIFVLFLSIFDYLYQRYDYMENLKMSKQEVKEEYKQYEGNPQIKGKLRNIQYSFAMKRMMQEVPKADVVITNPEHYAVALKYDKERMRAPELVAKGVDYIALKIKSVARENDVPIVENPPLARRIYRDVELNEPIPVELYQAVAEVLAYVFKLKNRSL